jgi:hypothetical protein
MLEKMVENARTMADKTRKIITTPVPLGGAILATASLMILTALVTRRVNTIVLIHYNG